MRKLLAEFKPTIFFLLKFLGMYVVGSLLYAWYITTWLPQPDPITFAISDQCAWLLNLIGHEAVAREYGSKPVVYLQLKQSGILTVYEGCNGVNVAIVFIAFLFGIGPYQRTLNWFVPLGLLVIHLSNLARIVLLFLVTLYLPDYLYFAHKYLFTAFIYLFVFLLWIVWVVKLAKPKVA